MKSGDFIYEGNGELIEIIRMEIIEDIQFIIGKAESMVLIGSPELIAPVSSVIESIENKTSVLLEV